MSVGSLSHPAAVVAMVPDQEAIMVTPRSGRRRLIVGIPGYHAVVPNESFVAHPET